MKNLIRFCVFFLSSWQVSIAQTPQQLPENGNEYEVYRDNSISDEFNSAKLDAKKWGRRNTGGASIEDYVNDKSLVLMEKETVNNLTTKYVSIKATKEKGAPKTAGLVNKASGFYGFYTVRFRFRGFDTDDVKEKGSVWHPAVWCALQNNTDVVKRTATKDKDFWTEIDFMEWENGANGWSSDAPARLKDSKGVKRKVITKGKGAEKAIMTKGPFQTYDPVWQTIGLEYTPEYLKLWKWTNGEWVHMGNRVVRFVEEDETNPESKYTISTIGKNARKPAFWILGNIVARHVLAKVENGTNTHTINDMALDFDFFRYYRHKSTVNIDWMWENGVKNGGGKINKDFSEIQTIRN
ncbi:hypothetical protein R3X25_01280 [Lutibacter sp. TH_r2]|uniref:hypothetical protein n=1 Tax=Lutibacter sp. TH_r2 TaxID=3082083 RepID=UPI0029554238|nr:hypothetical protein [Lutibacter sp. TH_r2]MDV7185896.1 hypothetical protein [Lutibacter sp. TH_r2]